MFSFFHKKKTIHVQCYTTHRPIMMNTPIVKSSKLIPEWWKNLPITDFKKAEIGKLEKQTNMRTCMGFLDLYQKGFIIPSWADLAAEISNDQYIFQNSVGADPTSHNPEQYGNAFDHYHHIKLASPWLIYEKTGIQFVMVPATWSHTDHIMLPLPGILDFKYQHGSNVNIFLPKPQGKYRIDIPIGMPLVQCIPLADNIKLKIENILVTSDEWNKYNYGRVSFHGMFHERKLAKKWESLCPHSRKF